jgi:simple sugar transport system ATP-binding protein
MSDSTSAIPRVELQNIHKTFGAVQSLRGVNLKVHPGEVLGLVGDNGAGKSTVMKVLAGTVVPDQGTILYEGKPVHFTRPRDARKLSIEMVYQDLALCDDLDVACNLFLGREPVRIPGFVHRKRMHEEAASLLQSLGISIPSTRLPVRYMSGGQRQAVAICRAVSFNPSVLIMDEPTSALAVREVRMVLDLIRRISERGVSVILITHRLHDLFEVCDRITVMFEGHDTADLPIQQTNLDDLVRHMLSEEASRA